jgi:hypothetical protein
MLRNYCVREFDELIYYRHYDQHRKNGPAVIWMDDFYGWREYDQRHRIDGPANIVNYSWVTEKRQFWIRGVKQC